MSDETPESVLLKAAKAAKEAFNKEISDTGFDPAYFSIDLQAFRLTDDFRPYRHSIELKDTERKEGEEESQ